MREILILGYICLVAMLCLYMAALVLEAKPKAQLNCAVAEISPDYSFADRQKCRLIRANKL
jgi:hypothetical protein